MSAAEPNVAGSKKPTKGSPWQRFGNWLRARGWRAVLIVTLAHTLGFVSSIHAVMSTRTSQGAVAWAVTLNAFPYVAVPAYWVFGRSKFDGYEMVRHREWLTESEERRETEEPEIS